MRTRKVPILNYPERNVRSSPAELFLHLCQGTVPHGRENAYYGTLLDRYGFSRDDKGNWFKSIGDRPTTAFMAHLDTACHESRAIGLQIQNNHAMTDGKSILGADDRAGVAVLLSLIHRKIPGKYCLFVGEEAGCVGSQYSARKWKKYTDILAAVSFDRKGKTEIITHQCCSRSCSDAYANALATSLNNNLPNHVLKPSADGMFTDTKSFVNIIPECTNIAVGYSHAHSRVEMQDLDYLNQLVFAAAKVDWGKLPIERAAGTQSYSQYFTYGSDFNYDYVTVYPAFKKPERHHIERIEPNRIDHWDHWDKLEFAVRNGSKVNSDVLYACLSEDQDIAFDLCAEYRQIWGKELWDNVNYALENS